LASRLLPFVTGRFGVNLSHWLVFSAASLWEIVIKSQLGREDFKADARVLRRALLDHGLPKSRCVRCVRIHRSRLIARGIAALGGLLTVALPAEDLR
jgi:hypothetical protein